MITRVQKIRLSIFFIVGCSVLLIVIIMLLGSKITEKRDTFIISYDDTSVAGLQIGGPVLYRGIRIGRIDDIRIDRENIMNIIVEISVKHGTPIKSDQVATLVLIGITGLKQIELTGGTNNSPFLNPGDRIIAGKSLFDSIANTAEILTSKIELIIDNINTVMSTENLKKIDSILSSIDEITTNAIQNVDDITTELALASVSLNLILSNLNEIIDKDKFINMINNTDKIINDVASVDLTQANITLLKLNETLGNSNMLISRIEALIHRNSPDITGIIEELKETMENLNEFSRLISDDPSILIWRRASE